MGDLSVMKKGQSALEYLVTYGWAILGIVIIAGVLVAFGIFNPERWAPARQQGGFSSFDVVDHGAIAGSGGVLTVVLSNKRGHTITVTGLTTATGGCSWSGSRLLAVTAPETFATTACTAASVTGASSGAPYDFSDLDVTFTDTTSGLTHTERGFIKGQFQ